MGFKLIYSKGLVILDFFAFAMVNIYITWY